MPERLPGKSLRPNSFCLIIKNTPWWKLNSNTNHIILGRSAVETNVAIICACLPTLRPLVVKIFPSLLTTSQNLSRPRGGTGTKRDMFAPKNTTVRSNVSGNHGFDEIKMGSLGADLEQGPLHRTLVSQDKIQVTTSFAQEVERTSETSSERHLVGIGF